MILKIRMKRMGTHFNKKFLRCKSNLDNIDLPDYSKDDTNLFVDFIELLTLFSNGDGISYGDIQDRFFGEPDENNSSEVDDTQESFIKGLLDLIKERISQYDDLYPFILDSTGQIFRTKDNLTPSNKLYVFLLMSSSLNIFKEFNSELTTDFESISAIAMQNFVPNAIVKSFGKNSQYKGTAKNKIDELAKELGINTNVSETKHISIHNTQERGLDIVSWIPFADNCQNKIIFLCQCACGKMFEYKQHDTSRYDNYFVFYKTEPQHTLFIPYSLINPKDNQFYHSDCIEKGCLLFERLRILRLIHSDSVSFNKLKSKKLLDTIEESQS